MEPLSPEENQDLIALLVTMAVDSGYLPLHGAEKLMIYGLIEVQETVISTPAGPRTFQVFEPTPRAIDFAGHMRSTSASAPLPMLMPGRVGGNDAISRSFKKLIPRGKRKWVASKKYLDSCDPDELPALIASVARCWWPPASS
ncbi:hypothetical protein [Paracoccus aerodenitrificans]|uniref:hypothetical protein n=1 Tax=Paracoccus aerodenitrificans TaxID=3017781 RepID=UPI0022F039E2|nr:hypothetical protein [Paracoccus aerodenitrificans]WBU63590.1 hypothetical protein PAE61_14710 [Paracoccus aerodenitrificans]